MTATSFCQTRCLLHRAFRQRSLPPPANPFDNSASRVRDGGEQSLGLRLFHYFIAIFVVRCEHHGPIALQLLVTTKFLMQFLPECRINLSQFLQLVRVRTVDKTLIREIVLLNSTG